MMRTLTLFRASLSLSMLRETRITFAPRAASFCATDKPRPSDAPVRRTVCEGVNQVLYFVKRMANCLTLPSTGILFPPKRPMIEAAAAATEAVSRKHAAMPVDRSMKQVGLLEAVRS